MTDPTTGKPAPIGFFAVLAMVSAVVALWPQAQPMLDWLLVNFGAVVLSSQAQAVTLGVLIGGGLAWRLPYHLPDPWLACVTRRRLVAYCSALTLVIAFGMERTPAGFAWACAAAIFGPVTLLYVLDFVHARLPQIKPGSLK